MDFENTRSLVFDLDGTLCTSKKRIGPEIEQALLTLSHNYDLWIVTGATYEQVKFQVPEHLLSEFTGVYCCLGTMSYDSQGNIKAEYATDFPDSMFNHLEQWANKCEFSNETKATFNHRDAMVNFSVLSNPQTDCIRKEFEAWDSEEKYRDAVVDFMTRHYPEYAFAAGGMVSIDITRKGYDKSLILNDPDLKDDVLFFGDKCYPGGNDYALASAIIEHERGGYYNVCSPEETLEILKKIRG
ncbi:MAG: hypothetical protein CMP47_12475 [Rickettsiales bacterium]|nr:hypothetical protein [Rickettsiales bacterium]|tara:strand:+ start:1927 stop:2652 length:726 start_codon:yes stop_codon:yes gene_type:complete